MKTFVDPQTGEILKRPENNYEVLDTTPVAIPARFNRASNLNEVVRQMVRSEELRRIAEAAGEETFDEADDFDVGDDYEPSSPYEEIFEGDVLKDNYARKVISKATEEKNRTAATSAPAPVPKATSGDGQ